MTEKRITEPLYVRLTAEERKHADKVAQDLHFRRTGDWAYLVLMDACDEHDKKRTVCRPNHHEGSLLEPYSTIVHGGIDSGEAADIAIDARKRSLAKALQEAEDET